MAVDGEDLLVDMVKSMGLKIDNILERLIRLEERTSRKAGLYGMIGGLVPAVGFFVYWLMSR